MSANSTLAYKHTIEKLEKEIEEIKSKCEELSESVKTDFYEQIGNHPEYEEGEYYHSTLKLVSYLEEIVDISEHIIEKDY